MAPCFTAKKLPVNQRYEIDGVVLAVGMSGNDESRGLTSALLAAIHISREIHPRFIIASPSCRTLPAMNFFIETVWVMFTYGGKFLAIGIVPFVAMVFWASRCEKRRARFPILFVSMVVLWVSMFIAADSGYRAWQSIPNPPEEAFSDTGPILFLVLGWLPSLGIALLLLRISPLQPSKT